MSAESSPDQPRIALITSGISPVAEYFTSLPASPVGIINWNNEKNNLLYADIYKRDLQTLTSTLAQWCCNLAITSRCSLVPTTALNELSHGAINLHPSWLPAYRGAEPLLWHIAENQDFIAASIHRLTDEYDCGSILAQRKMPRPGATDKASLLHLADTELGQVLLTDVISDLIENPDMGGVEQHSDGPTRYASRETSDSFGKQIPVNALKPQTVWDLSHYFGHCPMPWLVDLGLSGWCTKTHWKPAQLDLPSNLSDHDQWSIKVCASSVYLNGKGANIRLKPVFASLFKIMKN